MYNNRFIRLDDSFANGTGLIMNRELKNPNAIVGDFLARIWTIYGEPNEINYEGFGYTFKDSKTDLIFTAYSGASGPAYGSHAKYSEQILPAIYEFDLMLDSTSLADCEIEFETDFGIMRSGAKNGVPFDIIEE